MKERSIESKQSLFSDIKADLGECVFPMFQLCLRL